MKREAVQAENSGLAYKRRLWPANGFEPFDSTHQPVTPGDTLSRIIGTAGWSIGKSGRRPTNDISKVKIFQS